MRFDLADAMRSATRLTRRRDLSEASRVIQDARSGKAVSPPASDKMPPGENPTGNGRFGFIADFPRLHQSGTVIDGSAIQSATESGLHGRHRTRPIPLGTVVRALRHAKFRGFGLRNDSGESNRPTPHVPEGAQFLTGSFSALREAGHSSFMFRALPPSVADLCSSCFTQDPDDFAVGTDMNAVAEKHGLLVAYPAQSKASNLSSCWNWFNPKDPHSQGPNERKR